MRSTAWILSKLAPNNSFKPSPLRGLGHTGPHRAGRLNSGVRLHNMHFGKPTKAKNALFGALSIFLSGVMFYSWATFKGIPPRSDLQSASGQVSWLQSGKYGIKFGLAGIPKSFDYASKGNAMGLVRDTLSRSDHPVITVLYDPSSPGGPIYSKDVYYSVFELGIAGKPFRSHAEIAEAWQSDENIAVWLGICFALSGMYLSWLALRHRSAT